MAARDEPEEQQKSVRDALTALRDLSSPAVAGSDAADPGNAPGFSLTETIDALSDVFRMANTEDTCNTDPDTQQAIMRQLAARHPCCRMVFVDRDDNYCLAVDDNSARLLPDDFPRHVDGRGVRLTLYKGTSSARHPQTGARWNVPPDAAHRANTAIEHEGSAVVFAAEPTVLALVPAHPEDRGAVDYERVVVVALVDPAEDLPTTALRLGEFDVVFQHARPAARRGMIRVREVPDETYVTSATRLATVADQPRGLHIGQVAHRVSDWDLSDPSLTLGCFAVRLEDGAVVTLTAAHAIHPFEMGDTQPRFTVLTNDEPVATEAHTGVGSVYTQTVERRSRETRDYGYLVVREPWLGRVNHTDVGADADWRHADADVRNYTTTRSVVRRIDFSGRVAHESAYGSVLEEHRHRRDGTTGITRKYPDDRPVLFKFGAATRLTPGLMRAAHIYYNVGADEPPLRRYTVEPFRGWKEFAADGDSGSVVVTGNGDAVGMVVSCPVPHDELPVVIPMHEICERLQVRLLGTQHPPPPLPGHTDTSSGKTPASVADI